MNFFEDDRSYVIRDEHDNVFRFQAGLLHSVNDLQAVSLADGSLFYFDRGMLHRDEDKPAVVLSNGDKLYFRNDFPHRDGDKPAVELSDNTKAHYINGIPQDGFELDVMFNLKYMRQDYYAKDGLGGQSTPAFIFAFLELFLKRKTKFNSMPTFEVKSGYRDKEWDNSKSNLRHIDSPMPEIKITDSSKSTIEVVEADGTKQWFQ